MSPRRFIFLTYSSWSLESNTWRADNIYIGGLGCMLGIFMFIEFWSVSHVWRILNLFVVWPVSLFCGRKDISMQTCSRSFLFWYTYISFHSRFGRKNSPPFWGSGFITASDLAACRASVFGTKGGTNKNREKPTLPETAKAAENTASFTRIHGRVPKGILWVTSTNANKRGNVSTQNGWLEDFLVSFLGR